MVKHSHLDELDDVRVRDGVEDGDLGLDHVLLALTLGLVDDLEGELDLGLFAEALPHDGEVAVADDVPHDVLGQDLGRAARGVVDLAVRGRRGVRVAVRAGRTPANDEI